MAQYDYRDRAAFGMKTPSELAEELIRAMGDADTNTAHTALQIAALLLKHRDYAQLDFDRQLLNGSGLSD